jgi:hypothetical protein
MNKRGALFFSVSIGLFLFICGVIIMPYLADDITTFRVSMDCTNMSITNGDKVTCLIGDLGMPYFIWFFASMALGFVIGGKI